MYMHTSILVPDFNIKALLKKIIYNLFRHYYTNFQIKNFL